jgi:alkanesulfonate monooxygenase SsuD/methylene tetrahydromethanopterin reductase-like flavin-dependent oxidoreductase (luciferase family)
MNRARIGIQIGASTRPAELGAVAAEAERLGYGEIWLAEDYFELGGVSSVAMALAATERIPVGLGVVAAPARHPAATAMEFATLAGAYPGRFLAGVGHGAPVWVDQMGLKPASPLMLLRETTSAIRQLLGGVELNREGEYFRFDRIRLTHPPARSIPLYLGVHGPASLRLSGELADGTLLGWFSSPGYVAWARERIEEGRARADRQDPHELVVLCLLSISKDDPAGAGKEISRFVGPMLAGMAASPQLKASTQGVELSALIAREGKGVSTAALPDALLGEFVAAGDPTTCAATVHRLFEAGADRVVLVPNPAGFRSTAAMVDQMRTASALLRSADARPQDVDY